MSLKDLEHSMVRAGMLQYEMSSYCEAVKSLFAEQLVKISDQQSKIARLEELLREARAILDPLYIEDEELIAKIDKELK